MPAYFISYDLNGSTPTHAQMDKHLEQKYKLRQRILETVWFVCSRVETQLSHQVIDAARQMAARKISARLS